MRPALSFQVVAMPFRQRPQRIKDAGFTVNDDKSRTQLRGSRQTVTGLTVNAKVNVPQRYHKVARAMTHSFLTTGTYKLDGKNDTSAQRLEGILNHIYHIRERQIDLVIHACVMRRNGKSCTPLVRKIK
jgi:RNA-directed DNA polymerase